MLYYGKDLSKSKVEQPDERKLVDSGDERGREASDPCRTSQAKEDSVKRFLLITLGALLLSAPLAQADLFTPEAEAYYANAIQFWGKEPPLCVSISKEMQVALTVEGKTSPGKGLEFIGEASQPNPEYGPVNCFVLIKLGLESWELCRVIMHEVGHLEGLGHSADPTNIMYPQISKREYAPGCPDSPSSGGTTPLPEIPILAHRYTEWMKEITRCKRMALHVSHRRATQCWEMAKVRRWDYEEVSNEY